MFRYLAIYILILLSTACATEQDTEQVIQEDTGFKPPIKCSSSSPILDTKKIIIMLEKNGTITTSMTKEEIDIIVNDYIQRKNKAAKDCK